MARWHTCNILQLAPDAKRLWQFDAKGDGFAPGRELKLAHTQTLPGKYIAKSWASLWAPKLNIAWLPPESVFLRVVELPASNAEETASMVELQLEKLSPVPVTQLVWTLHVLGTRQSEAKADGTTESLQTVVVVIVARSVVEEFLGRLERDGFLADRLEVPMLDQLETVAPKEDGTWLFPLTLGGQNAALVAWWYGGALRNLSFITLPIAGDRAAELKTQLSLLAMAGEMEGWLTAPPRWHLVADPVNATEWETCLRAALDESVQVTAPPAPVELAGRTARRAANAGPAQLLPAEFSSRYHQQFIDRLWLRGLFYAGCMYGVFLAIYFCAVGVLGYRTQLVEDQVSGLGGSYTNVMQLKARYDILKERSQLKYAALDCWQLIALELPSAVSLQRFSFADGQKLTLSGTAPQDQVNPLFSFNEAVLKKRVNGQPVFDSLKGTTVNPKIIGNNLVSWNFSVELLHPEVDEK